MATVVSMTWEELLEKALQLPSEEKEQIARTLYESLADEEAERMRIPPRWRRRGRRRSSAAWRRSRTAPCRPFLRMW